MERGLRGVLGSFSFLGWEHMDALRLSPSFNSQETGFPEGKGLVEVMQLVRSYRMERGPPTPNQGEWKHDLWGSGLDGGGTAMP